MSAAVPYALWLAGMKCSSRILAILRDTLLPKLLSGQFCEAALDGLDFGV